MTRQVSGHNGQAPPKEKRHPGWPARCGSHDATGPAEWQAGGPWARRVRVVTSGVNSTATLLYGSSWLARRRGRHWTGVLLGVGGGVMATLGGYFGGHLSLVRKVGTADPALGDSFGTSGPG